MFYIVGLGNPGKEYAKTRHNIGWVMLEHAIDVWRFPALVVSSKYVGRISEGVREEHEITMLLPDTFMNKSGVSVGKLVPKSQSNNLIVVYDDVDIPVGEVKVSFGKGDGGHNGIKSIIGAMGTRDFVRIRVGVASKSFWKGETKRPQGGMAMQKHVLGNFSFTERNALDQTKTKVLQALDIIFTDGVEKAMNEIN